MHVRGAPAALPSVPCFLKGLVEQVFLHLPTTHNAPLYPVSCVRTFVQAKSYDWELMQQFIQERKEYIIVYKRTFGAPLVIVVSVWLLLFSIHREE